MPRLTISSPLGPLTLVDEEGFLVQVTWRDEGAADATPTLSGAAAELEAYFAGWHDGFLVPVAPSGSEVERKVWSAMCRIPRGHLRTYGDVAEEVGVTAQEVGQACGRNPIPVVIPCHRIVAANGRLGGYSGKGSLRTKRWLIGHEAKPLGPIGGLICPEYPISAAAGRVQPLRPYDFEPTETKAKKGEQTCLTFS